MNTGHKRKPTYVKPKDASTVILLRRRPNAGTNGIEVLMVLRHPGNRFVADAYVYPGGALDEEDCAPAMEVLCRGMTREKAVGLMGDIPPEKALGALVAGIRETFEEVGILLAYTKDGELVTFSDRKEAERFSDYRDALGKGAADFRSMLEKEGLTLATDRLHYFSHWVTPEPLPIRYDVRFFVAEAPKGQEALHDGHELVGHIWVTPQEALDAYHRGDFKLVLPTIMTLKELCAFGTVEDVVLATKGKNIPRILTKMEHKEGRTVEIMPDGSVFAPSPCEDKNM
jgi:8-oxo-dGTP pyrophosphatase MutT (NUDIX family)